MADALTRKRKALLMERGLTQTYLAKRWDVSQPHVSAIMNGRERSLLLERDLAKLIGVKHGDIFPPPSERQLRNRRKVS